MSLPQAVGFTKMAPSPAQIPLLALARLSVIILLWFPAATAQYRFDSWTTDNGLPQNSVSSIIQTRDGYLWMTTFDGQVRFNGVQFKVFDKSNTSGLSTNRFTALYEDKDGTLWIGTNDAGVARYRNGVFTSLAIGDGVPAGPVLFFAHDLDGELLVGIGSGQFYMRAGKFIRVATQYQTQTRKLYLAPSGAQWTIEANEARQLHAGRVTRYPIKLTETAGLRPYADSESNLWVGDNSAMYRLRDGQATRYSEKEGVPPGFRLRPFCEETIRVPFGLQVKQAWPASKMEDSPSMEKIAS